MSETAQAIHKLNLTVRDQPGVLVRVAHLFARRGCNIRSVVIKPLAGNVWSTMVIEASDISDTEQLIAQLHKLVDVRDVHEETNYA